MPKHLITVRRRNFLQNDVQLVSRKFGNRTVSHINNMMVVTRLPRNLFVRRLQIRKLVFFNQAEFAKHVQSTVNRCQAERLVFFSRPVQNLVHRKMIFEFSST